ncbi:MAG: flagellar hook basal-body protein [Ignavibacteriales bacterium]|nr:MAG: flagellar hook basal-body protein [Ignavibacteriales bacterium]
MIDSIAKTTQKMQTQQKDMEIIANNLANINSTGYKREEPFTEFLKREEFSGFKQITDFREGALITTGNPYDFSLSGTGFFVIQTDEGNELTRNGKFKLSEEGYLVNDKGNKVLGQKGPISLSELLFDPSKSIRVSTNGEIKVGDKILDKILIGKIESQENLLRNNDQSFIYEKGDFGHAKENEYEISQGYIEESNVNPIIEMMAMIELNRSFESSQKLMQNFDQHLGRVNEIGKI